MKLPKCKYKNENTEMDLAYVKKGARFMIEDHGCPFLSLTFDYGGSQQGFGYIVNLEIIMKLMKVFEAEYLDHCSGHIFVEHNNMKIFRLISTDGKRILDMPEYNSSSDQKKKEPD